MIASDGDMEEGVTGEASSLAGTQQLGNLIVFYDNNKISIEHDTDIALCEDVARATAAYGWHVQEVEGGENVVGIEEAIAEAKKVTDKPSFIVVRTIIGYPAPTKMNTGGVHGSALGADEVAATKKVLGFDPDKNFEVARRGHRPHPRPGGPGQGSPRRVAAGVRRVGGTRARAQEAAGPAAGPGTARRLGRRPDVLGARLQAGGHPRGVRPGAQRRRAEAARVVGRLSGPRRQQQHHHQGREVVRPAVDLHRGLHRATGTAACCTSASASTRWDRSCPGIVLHGPTRAFGGTFLQFSDYMRPAVRLASLMDIDTIYIWTHDSIGLGEDGPTHQPIEHLAALRAIPNLSVVRPGDPNETAYAWRTIVARGASSGPVGFILTRQGIPVLEGTSAEGVAKGGYVLGGGNPADDADVVIIATGSELQLAVEARKLLADKDIDATVVSMPCVEWFESSRRSTATRCCRRGCRRGWPSRRASRCPGTSSSATPARSCRSSTTANPPTTRPCSASSGSPPKPSSPRRNAHWITERRHEHNDSEPQPGSAERRRCLRVAGRPVPRAAAVRQPAGPDRHPHIVGVTTNPSIFQAALPRAPPTTRSRRTRRPRRRRRRHRPDRHHRRRPRRLRRARQGSTKPSDGVDGRVSIEVDPRLAHDTDKTIAQAIELCKIVDRPNLLIKIPATLAGLPAITAVIAEGISVNVTLIFSLERYKAVMDAYLAGLQAAKEAGHDLSQIHSVASFFVSRVDTEIDKRLKTIGSREALALRGKAGVANARLAYPAYEQIFDGPPLRGAAGRRRAACSARCGRPPA